MNEDQTPEQLREAIETACEAFFISPYAKDLITVLVKTLTGG